MAATRVHLVQGDPGPDKRWLDRAIPRTQGTYTSWVVPKKAEVGDLVVIYIGGHGFYATGVVETRPKARSDWERRYGARLKAVRLVQPPISLATIRRRLPSLRWANYPRSIHTLGERHAAQVRALLSERRHSGLPDLAMPSELSIEELRAVALAAARRRLPALLRTQTYRQRSEHIKRYVLRRAAGVCEGCGIDAPFSRSDGSPYLEPHHLTRVADDGPDHPAKVAAICPNCHARIHHGADRVAYNRKLAARIRVAERGASSKA